MVCNMARNTSQLPLYFEKEMKFQKHPYKPAGVAIGYCNLTIDKFIRYELLSGYYYTYGIQKLWYLSEHRRT